MKRKKISSIQFLDSMHAPVFSTGGDTALVLDVGYHTTKIQAVLHLIFIFVYFLILDLFLNIN